MLEEILNYLSSAFVFVPLIILGLFILIKTGLKIQKWTYDRKMDGGLKWHKFPPFYPFKLLIQYLIIPIFKVLFVVVKGIAKIISQNKFKTVILSICVLILGSGFYVYKNKPDFYLKYSITLTRLFIFFAAISFLFVVVTQMGKGYESNIDGSEDYIPKSFKMAKQSGSYLYSAIIMGIIIGILSIVLSFLGTSEAFNVTASGLIMLICGIGALFMLYSLGKNVFKKQLKDNPWFNIIYHAVFIIPCILTETTEYLYREFKTTPEVVYKILGLEILVVLVWFILPIITEKLYTYSPGSNNKEQSVKNKIDSIENTNLKINNRLSKIKSNSPYPMSDSNWDDIRKNGWFLNDTLTNAEFKKALKDWGFDDDKVKEINKYVVIDGNGMEYQKLFSARESGLKEINTLNKALGNLSTLENSKFLLKKAVYLNKETRINPLSKDFHYGYGVDESTYNYSISFWIFLHSNNTEYKSGDNEYKNILNYDNRPKIAYNIQENALRIYVTKPSGSLVTLFTERNFPLQRWHNIVINYTGGNLDVFLNAKLVATQSKVLPKMGVPNLLLGEDKGVQGGITNILYFPTFMSRTRIEANYRLLRENPQKFG